MRVLMLGWEFPPFISGGLGTACYGLTRAMSDLGVEIVFVLPRPVDATYATHVKLRTPAELSQVELTQYTETLRNVTIRAIDSPLRPYSTAGTYHQAIDEAIMTKLCSLQANTAGDFSEDNYGSDIYTEVHRYACMANRLAAGENFDLIHAHDWMTYPAAIAVADYTGKPLVVHIHSTEFDRSGRHVNQAVYDIERRGLHRADRVIAVSNLTRKIVLDHYAVPPEKVYVVHNGVERPPSAVIPDNAPSDPDREKIVLFLGRITMQKGPEYFLQAARKVLDVMPLVRFVMVGSGDMMNRSIELAAHLGIGQKVSFTGFLRGPTVDRIFSMADVCVMPSVSEPFGIVPLEALRNNVPVIISRQSGVAEVLNHALKVDFWDTQEMANKIVAVLKYDPLQVTLRNYGNFEIRKLRWHNSAVGCVQAYEHVMAAGAAAAT